MINGEKNRKIISKKQGLFPERTEQIPRSILRYFLSSNSFSLPFFFFFLRSPSFLPFFLPFADQLA
jgi:hypothetical protein